jgi:adenosylcobinamide-GDP ribazoletransferase
MRSILAAITFYTIIPLPSTWQLNFARITRFAPLIGMIIGSILGLVDWGLSYSNLPLLSRSVDGMLAFRWGDRYSRWFGNTR